MTPLWRLPPPTLQLDRDEVHIWRAFLDLPATTIRQLSGALSPDEQDRGNRFHFERDRLRFIAARGLLRTILSRYLAPTGPDQLRFSYGAYGKPTLIQSAGDKSLHFSVSHSNGLALYGITYDREIGIDLEYLRSDMATETIAERFFASSEVAALRALSNEFQTEAFFNCWTRKEAYIKARGEGLSFPLHQFEVSLVPGEPAVLVRTQGDEGEASRWSMQALSPGPGYVAAVTVQGHDWQLKTWQWSIP
jgi:4'-phosphopantetheinyl transferase